MNDPHVAALRYKVIHMEFMDYDKAPPLEVEKETFVARIAEGEAVLRMKAHYSTEASAKAAVQDFIRGW